MKASIVSRGGRVFICSTIQIMHHDSEGEYFRVEHGDFDFDLTRAEAAKLGTALLAWAMPLQRPEALVKVEGSQVGALVLTESQYETLGLNQAGPESAALLDSISAEYKLQQVYTHLDLYSPQSSGEKFVYRIKL